MTLCPPGGKPSACGSSPPAPLSQGPSCVSRAGPNGSLASQLGICPLQRVQEAARVAIEGCRLRWPPFQRRPATWETIPDARKGLPGPELGFPPVHAAQPAPPHFTWDPFPRGAPPAGQRTAGRQSSGLGGSRVPLLRHVPKGIRLHLSWSSIDQERGGSQGNLPCVPGDFPPCSFEREVS